MAAVNDVNVLSLTLIVSVKSVDVDVSTTYNTLSWVRTSYTTGTLLCCIGFHVPYASLDYCILCFCSSQETCVGVTVHLHR